MSTPRRSQLSHDAEIAYMAIRLAKLTGRRPLAIVREAVPRLRNMSRKRWETLLAELRRHGYEESGP